jgi:hypothetical protein
VLGETSTAKAPMSDFHEEEYFNVIRDKPRFRQNDGVNTNVGVNRCLLKAKDDDN